MFFTFPLLAYMKTQSEWLVAKFSRIRFQNKNKTFYFLSTSYVVFKYIRKKRELSC